jgi:lipooligosaccharide transport system ATP-binding protein
MLARALVNRPRLLVLDEPTTGLDPQARLSVWEQLFRLRREGVTLVVTTHYMEEAARLCDRLAIMHRGEILCEGTPAALVRERIEPQVLEIPDGGPADRAAERLAGLATRTARHGGTVYCYGPDGGAMLRRLEEAGAKPPSHVLRPANLEDLFLTLTGTELSE